MSDPGGHTQLLFALSSDPTAVTSGVEFFYSTDGFDGSLSGSFGGFVGVPYFFTSDPTFPQNGPTQFSGVPFLSYSFTPEAVAVPEPATLMLLGPAAAFFARRRFARR